MSFGNKAMDPRLATLSSEDNPKGTISLKAPRLTTALAAYIALRVEVPTTGQSNKVKLSPYTTVRDTIALIEKELAIVPDEPFGLYARVIKDNSEEVGIWLLEDRTLWSYQLEDLTLVEFKPKTPEHHEVRIVVPSQEIVSNLSYDQFTTVKEVIHDVSTQNNLPHDKYALYLTRESLWLNEAETLASYQLTPSDTVEYKKRTGDNEEKPKSVLLDIGLPQHGTTRKLLVSLTTTVAEVISMILRKAAVLETSNYGLYLLPRDGRPGMWMEDYKFLASFPLENEEKLEFKSKFKQFIIEASISSRQRPSSTGQQSDGLIMKPLVDDSATVQEAIEMVIAEFSLNSNRNYGLFLYDEEQLAPERKLFDVGNKDSLVFHAVRKPLRFALQSEPQNIETINVDFDEVGSKIAQTVARKFGVSQHANYTLRTGPNPTDTIIGNAQSLFDLEINENALLILHVENINASGSGGANRPSYSRNDSRLDDGDYDINIWDEGPDAETNIIFDVPDKEGNTPIRAGSFNKLVERLTDSKTPDLKFVKTFLLTYQSFTTPERLLQKLIERYNVVRAPNTTYADFQVTQKSIQARVCNAMKLWMESPQPDFEENEVLQENMLVFIRDTLAIDSPKLAKQLRNAMQKAKQGGANRERHFGFDSNAPEIKVPKNMNENLTITDFDPEEIARQMTLIDFKIFASIKPAELLNQAWNKEKQQHKAQNVITLIKRINEIGCLVATGILIPKDPKIRAKMFTIYVGVASSLFAMGNFSTCMAVIGGLNNSSILRLKNTKKEVDKKVLKKLSELEKALSPESNYRALRELLHKVNPPCFPYLGVYTSDLTFLDDGNPNFINNLVNFEKRRLVYSIISDLITYQDKPYNFMPFPELKSLLLNIESIPDKELYEYSLKREPRE